VGKKGDWGGKKRTTSQKVGGDVASLCFSGFGWLVSTAMGVETDTGGGKIQAGLLRSSRERQVGRGRGGEERSIGENRKRLDTPPQRKSWIVQHAEVKLQTIHSPRKGGKRKPGKVSDGSTEDNFSDSWL